MARRGEIEIPIAVDTGGVEKSIRNGLIDPIEDAEQALEELGKVDSGRSLERDLDRASDALDDLADTRAGKEIEDELKKAQRATNELDDDLGDTRRALDKLSYAAKDVGDEGKKGFGAASEAGTEFKQEALSNFSEVTSSFDGSMSSIQDLAQGTLGGLASTGLPGIGLAAGAAAVGIGLIGGAIEGVGEEQERLKEQATEWADAFRDAGSKVLGSAQLVERGLSILQDRYEEVTENAKNWGVAEETAVAAMAGSPAALAEVEKSLRAKTEAAEEDARAAAKVAEENGGVLLSETLMQAEVRKGTSALNFQKDAMQKGGKQADTYSYFLRDLAANTEGATRKVDKFGDTVVSLPDGTKVYIDAETGQATDDVDAIERKIYGIKDKEAKVSYKADTRSVDNYRPKNKHAYVDYEVRVTGSGLTRRSAI